MVNAPTGSGKTLAYLAPIVSELARLPTRPERARGTLALVVCPTRELTLQVHNVLSGLLRRFYWLVGGSVTGGESRERETARRRKGCHVLSATPGRLLDHLLNTSAFRTDELAWLVLDEADRLLDLGFEEKVREILRVLAARRAPGAGSAPAGRVTALFSATLGPGVERLAGLTLRDPVSIGLEPAKQDREEGEAGVDAEGDDDDDDQGAVLDQLENPETGPTERPGPSSTGALEFPPRLQQYYLEASAVGRVV